MMKMLTWFNQLKPAFGKDRFFFEDELDEMLYLKKTKMFENWQDKINPTHLKSWVFKFIKILILSTNNFQRRIYFSF